MVCQKGLCRNTINLLGINIDVVDSAGLYDRIVHFIQSGKRHKVMYINAHCMVISQKDESYCRVLRDAQLVYTDGMGIVWGARMLGQHLPGRLTAADFMPTFFKLFAGKGLKVYLLGARPGVAEAAARILKLDNPGLQIVGTHHGYFKSEECDKIIETINKTAPHILMVGMGVPYQENWIDQHFSRLHVPVIWGVGALFDFVSRRLARGPQWLLDSGFEWLCRLFVEPRRLWRRYLIGNLWFMWYVLRWKFCREDGGPRQRRKGHRE